MEARLWSRWQERHNETAFEELVRPHLRFLRGFARRLGCGAADADDVVQNTLVRLADDRTPKPATVGLRAWLGRTLLSEVRMFFRGRGRRQRHERQARIRPPQGIEAIDHRDEVEAALGALKETERRAIVLRFLHDLDYAEMAYILGITRRAARLRVHRGVARLRKRLGSNALASLAALPLLGGNAAARQVLVREAVRSTAVAAGAVSLTKLGGVLLMTTTAKVCLGGCAALVAGLFLWQSGERDDSSDKRAERKAASVSVRQKEESSKSTSPATTPDVADKPRTPTRLRPDAPIPPGKGSVIGRVVFSDGEPLKRTKLALSGTPRVVAETDDEGRYHIHGDWVANRSILIVGQRDYTFSIGSVEMKPDERVRVDVEIERGVELKGTVRGPLGKGVLSAELMLQRPGANSVNLLQGGFGRVKSDARGRFSFQYLPDGPYTLLVTAKGCEPHLHAFRVESRNVDLDLNLKEARPLIIRFENLPEAAKGERMSWGTRRYGDSGPMMLYGRKPISEDSEIVLDAPPPGKYRLTLYRTRYTPRVERDIEIKDDAAPVVVRLPRGSRVEGTLRDADGRVLAGVKIAVTGGRSKNTDEQGRFVLDWVPDGERELWLIEDNTKLSLGRFGFPTSTLELRAPGRASLKLKLPGNANEHTGVVTIFGESRKLAEGRPDAYGRLHFRRLRSGTYKVTMYVSGHAFETRWVQLHPAEQLDLGEVALRKYIEVPVVVTGAGGLRYLWAHTTLKSKGPQGQVSLTHQSGHITLDENGRGLLKRLTAGTFTVTIRGHGRQPVEVKLTLREGQVDPIRIDLPSD